MSGSLIINARDRLSWHRRLGSDASTFLMWGIWLKLWIPVLGIVARAAGFGFLHRATYLSHASTLAAHDLPRYAFALAGTSGTLFLWNRLPGVKVRAPEAPATEEYARAFDVAQRDLESARESPICVVHHDETGRIVRIERGS